MSLKGEQIIIRNDPVDRRDSQIVAFIGFREQYTTAKGLSISTLSIGLGLSVFRNMLLF